MYKPKDPPQLGSEEGRLIIKYLFDELQNISSSFEIMEIDKVKFTELHAAPDKPRLGDVYLADGSDWDPLTVSGSDPYFVWYDGAGYHGLHETGSGANLG